ncbi:MAG: hypothetical protein WCX46_01435 [Candidatus Paceibacterota bacterium]
MNKKIISVIVGIIVLAGVFYGGIFYSKNKTSNKNQTNQAFGQNNRGLGNNIGMKSGGGFGGLNVGEIISKDDESVTLKLKDGGSKIIFYSNKTTISKTTDGTIDDLVVGKQVNINGKSNPDGSISAESIQIRPNLPEVQQ